MKKAVKRTKKTAATRTAKTAGTLQITTPSEREIAMTRAFDAPRALVFDALTRPELVKRWLGVRGWTMDVCEIDLRVGGTYRYVWRKAGVPDMAMGGVYREVVTPERVAATESFDQKWYEGEGALATTVLVEARGKTTVTMTVRYASKAVRDAVLKSPMKDGVAEGYDRLADLLASSVARKVK